MGGEHIAVLTSPFASRTSHSDQNGNISCDIDAYHGRVRLYSTKTFKPLGTLSYHKKSCQAVAFARSEPRSIGSDGGGERHEEDEDEYGDEMSEVEKEERTRWLVSGGQDHRVAIWSLIEFGKT